MTMCDLVSSLSDPRPIHIVLREAERNRGFRVVVPGDEPWLPAADWHPTVVVSVAGRDVRLVAILATKPGSGAFTRMVGRILASGLQPVVLCPTYAFSEALRRRGWNQRFVGTGAQAEEHWRPSRRTKLALKGASA